MKSNRGFTLIELLIALVIFSVLVSVAVPGYQSQLRESRRDDARHLLMLNAQRLQRCFTLEGVYTGSCATRSTSKNGYYTLETSLATNSFTLTAKPVAGSSQAKDDDCLSFSYDSTGLKSATGAQADQCW